METNVINRSTSLTELVPGLKKQGKYFVGPCPFCGGDDRFNVKRTEDGDLWICRKCGDGKYHDAIAFLMRRDGLSFMDVVGAATSGTGNVGRQGTGLPPAASHPRSRPGPLPREPEFEEPPDEDWQITTLSALKECLDNLHQSESADAGAIWRYLTEKRGLAKETIFGMSLGYNPAWKEVAPGRWLAPGVVIPCMVDGELWYVKVRTTQAARDAAKTRNRTLGKYHLLSGSRVGALYNVKTLYRALAFTANERLWPQTYQRDRTLPAVVVVEGEFDALLLGQHLPDGWAAVTMGSAGTLPGRAARGLLLPAARIYVSLDQDEAGQKALESWRELIPVAERLAPLPEGVKDITEFWKSGGDIRSWISQ